ncbi:hypothetical protein [Hydrogenobacter hydrogenophilus]|uniref:Uncharacterized protein n=1 Tax=Hydrogenobacter hydrogenophilus TaxID=35835 RepID=A0A285NVQ3_9AQUI|nr:hypothetical protein [Hydrogenobacter hydrogenophilus]SNZ13545.1 hypothetical protein SAMN06265353_0779 [Hydrogenobacter hydrogenophilus]
MLRDVNLVLLTVRLLIALMFIMSAFKKPTEQKAIIVFLTTVYVSLSILPFLYPTKTRNIKRFVDLIMLPPLAFFTHDIISTLSLLAPAVFYVNRLPAVSLFLFWACVLTLLLVGGLSSTLYIPLLFALFLSAVSPDLVDSIRKERHYIKKLRTSYRELSKNLSRFEKEAKEREYLSFLLDRAIEDKSPEEFLTHIKERFSLKKIAIIAKGDIQSKDALLDKESLALYVPVFFEKGSAYVVFYFNTLFELYDKELTNTLEKSAKLLNLYIVGFDDNVKKDTIKLAV